MSKFRNILDLFPNFDLQCEFEGVPYSEHSSYSELQDFVTALKPVKVQPTVNVGSEPKRTAMMEHISKWLAY
jgi:DNA cross-link repair 1A protein